MWWRHRLSSTQYPSARPYASPTGERRRRSVPERVRRYYAPLSVLEATDRVMSRFGRERRECYVWWGGYFTESGEAQILTAIYPDTATDYGCVHLRTPELVALHEKLRALDQVLLVELHTHPPGAGGQNDVDAAHPAATYNGFISIVIPDFARPRFHDLRKTYVYEYAGRKEWRSLDPVEISARFVIEETCIAVATR